jgi:hypothetical protein
MNIDGTKQIARAMTPECTNKRERAMKQERTSLQERAKKKDSTNRRKRAKGMDCAMSARAGQRTRKNHLLGASQQSV